VDVFGVRERLVGDYGAFTSGFVHPRDRRIAALVEEELAAGVQWPDPWLSLNPSFEPGGSITELVARGLLHPECDRIFRVKQHAADPGARSITLHRHQLDAIRASRDGESYVLTTGTGSGKSLSYIIPIVDSVLRRKEAEPHGRGVSAIVVYPMNALANSQVGELEKFLERGYADGTSPVTFRRYTGQESPDERAAILRDPPDILLTNYVMLELVLTRPEERVALVRAARGLRFLVFDELHTYRGRQGADVAMLIRRVRQACESPGLQCVGTSATMSSEETTQARQQVVADVATRLFGTTVRPDHVIGETLTRETTGSTDAAGLAASVGAAGSGDRTYHELAADPLATWIELTFGLATEKGTDRLVRGGPITVQDAAHTLAKTTGIAAALCEAAIRSTLDAGARVRSPETNRPLFAFRVHQFLSKGDTVYASLEPEETRHLTSRYQLVVPGSPEKILLPTSYCRECGQEYLVVRKSRTDGVDRFHPRRDRDASGGDDVNGYLYVSGSHPWPADPLMDARLPDSWITTDAAGHPEVVTGKRRFLPERLTVDVAGATTDPGEGLSVAFVPTPFAFCLRCRVSYEQLRGSDFAKLASLDTEGRSSAISVISSSVVRSLLGETDLEPEARKLLTFVDPATPGPFGTRTSPSRWPPHWPCPSARTRPTRRQSSASARTPIERFAKCWPTACTPTSSAAGGSRCRTWSRPVCSRSTNSICTRSPMTRVVGTVCTRRCSPPRRGCVRNWVGSCSTNCAGCWRSTSTA
jgi:DEAD/DEAH box helicase